MGYWSFTRAMKYRNKRRWNIIKGYSIGWILAFVLYSIFRGEGTEELGSVQFELWRSIIVSIIIGPIIGSISGYAQILTEERGDRSIPLQRLLIFRFVYAILFVAATILVAHTIVTTFAGVTIGLLEFAFEPGSFSIYLYILLIDLFFAILRQVNLLLGEGKLGKLIRGEFYTPKEEERIFMFLDLKSSVELAETLGHQSYSKLIQDCFNDLGVVAEHEAEIYQYVGDEVVLTWKLQDGIRKANCLNAYFSFKQELAQKSDYYLNKYNCEPFFKAGINAGNVMVSEIGKYKKDIAYHGDAINTAARIQGMCNEFDQAILISEDLKNQFGEYDFKFERLGAIPLKGKQKEVPIYSVLEAD